MRSVKYFCSERSMSNEKWKPIYSWFEKNNVPINLKPEDCDISVALEGKFVNPVALCGKKILLCKPDEWQIFKWVYMYKPILEEYYDKIVDITEIKPEQISHEVENVCASL